MSTPLHFDVLRTENMFDDILSDLGAGLMRALLVRFFKLLFVCVRMMGRGLTPALIASLIFGRCHSY